MAKEKTFYENIENARVLLESAGWREGAGCLEQALGYIYLAEEELKEAKACLRRAVKEKKRRAA